MLQKSSFVKRVLVRKMDLCQDDNESIRQKQDIIEYAIPAVEIIIVVSLCTVSLYAPVLHFLESYNLLLFNLCLISCLNCKFSLFLKIFELYNFSVRKDLVHNSIQNYLFLALINLQKKLLNTVRNKITKLYKVSQNKPGTFERL